jgi:hypothetical protein
VIPPNTSVTFPVGSTPAAAAGSSPALSSKSSTTGAAVPGTPSIATSPEYRGLPPGVGNVAVTMPSVFTILIRTRVSCPPAVTRPRSTANGPMPARMLPQFCRSVTTGSSTTTWRNR